MSFLKILLPHHIRNFTKKTSKQPPVETGGIEIGRINFNSDTYSHQLSNIPNQQNKVDQAVEKNIDPAIHYMSSSVINILSKSETYLQQHELRDFVGIHSNLT
jgi:hypothetical protein